MSEDTSFRDLIARVRAGDDQAWRELLRRYEPAIRVVVESRLTDPRLRRLLDTSDIWQSVLLSFFVRAAAGQFQLDSPEQLVKLLATMARNKVTNQALKQQAARRDYRRQQDLAGAAEPVARDPSPSQVLANRELVEKCRGLLSEEERFLADERAAGRSWEEIAAAVGGTPAALYMRLKRGLDRVARQLGLEA